MPTKPIIKPTVKNQPPLPIGVGRVPKWWMDLTPHDKLDLAEHEAQTKIQEQMSRYYLKLAAAGLVGQDGHLVTLPDGQPDWSRIQELRIRLNPKLFGVADKDPEFHLYESGELLPQEFKLKMQEMYGSITPNQLEYKKYGATKDDNKPGWAKMTLRHSKEGDMIRSGVDIDEGPNGYTRRFGGASASDTSEKPAVMIVGGKRLVRKVRRVPKKKDNSLSPNKPVAAQMQQHQQQQQQNSPRRVSKVPQRTTESRKPLGKAPPVNGRRGPPSPRRSPQAAQRRISPPPNQKSSWNGTSTAPRAQQYQSSQNGYPSANGTRSSHPSAQQTQNVSRPGNKQPAVAHTSPSLKSVGTRTPQKQKVDQSEAATPVMTNNKHSERLITPLLNEPPSIRVSSYQPTPTKPPPSSVAPAWRQAPEHNSYDHPPAPPTAVQRVPPKEESRGTHKLLFLADEDDSEPAMISPAPDERYEEEEYEEVEGEYYDADYHEQVNGENDYYEEEEEVLSIHEVFVDEEVEGGDGSSYYEEEVIDDSGEIEYYEEEEEEAINELEAKLAAKQAQLARLC